MYILVYVLNAYAEKKTTLETQKHYLCFFVFTFSCIFRWKYMYTVHPNKRMNVLKRTKLTKGKI